MTHRHTLREVAALCAALYTYQNPKGRASAQELALATAHGRCRALTAGEIETLLHRLSDLLKTEQPTESYLLPCVINDRRLLESPSREQHIDLSKVTWVDVSPRRDRLHSRLVATLFFNHVPHFLEAIEIRESGCSSQQTARASDCQSQLLHYQDLDPEGGPFRTVRFKRRRYALFVVPHSQ